MSYKILTAYELSCGCIQAKTTSERKVTLHREHTVYHVRAFNTDGLRLAWDSFKVLTNARKRFSELLNDKTQVQ